MFSPLANVSAPWTLLMDIIFILALSMIVSYYFYYYKKKEILGGYIGATVIAIFGSILLFAFFHKVVRDFIMWLMSPKIGTIQLSNVNLIVIVLGAFLSLFIVDVLQKKRRRE
ncbi:MAG: hypothetical protein EBS19_02040 [Spirochaetia bacterium]|nr:hypothetical protein [Spirochaetia bacterium]